MSDVLRALETADHAWLLQLNEQNVEVLSPLDHARLEALLGWGARVQVVQHGGERAGFVITFGPGSDYDSAYYRWFAAAYDDFVYLDRVVLDVDFRRLGLGSRTYDALEAELDGRPMLLEVNVDPPNDPSLAFHGGRGYVEVSRLGEPGKQVAMMQGPQVG